MKNIHPKIILLSIVMLVWSAVFGQTKLLARNNNEYCNARYKYCIWYPRTMKAGPEAENGDGRSFSDGRSNIRVYGRGNWNEEGETLSLQEKYTEDTSEQKDRKITYSKLGKTFYVLSGNEDGRVFYQNTVQLTDAFGTAILDYRPADSIRYKNIASLILQNFKRAAD